MPCIHLFPALLLTSHDELLFLDAKCQSPCHKQSDSSCLVFFLKTLTAACHLQADSCGIWQHCSCVGIDPNAMPDQFFCQSCRIALADPFWQAESIQLIPPAMLRSVPGRPVVIRSSGKDQVMAVERAFNLTPPQLEPLRKNTQTEQLHVGADDACVLNFCSP